jgi:uncharacterized membrane protein YeaQ/YmgE (transglycosylase-associated protein family)
MFGIFGWIIFGAIVGVIAKLLHRGRDPAGCIITILIGIAGSVIGGYLGHAIGLYREGESAGFIMSVIGAILLLAIYSAIVRRR